MADQPAAAASWPMWGYDQSRSGVTPRQLPPELHLQWTRRLPTPRPAWPRQEDDGDKLAFDRSYEPIVQDGLIFVPSMVNDNLTAYCTATGEQRWRFNASGPVRFAPAAWREALYFTSDDGYLYCLEAATGKLRWKFRGGPGDRQVLGNQRLISAWPARGAPVIADGTVFFTAGLWPFMGIFVHALDAETGEIIWTNSGSGSAFVRQVHQSAGAFAGVAPQGYLAISGDLLLVPGSRARPAGYLRETGEFVHFNLNPRPAGKFGPAYGGYAVRGAGDYYFVYGEMLRARDGEHLTQVGRHDQAVAIITDQAAIGLGNNRITAYQKEPAMVEVEAADRRGEDQVQLQVSLPELWSAPAPEGVERIHLKAGSSFFVSGSDGLVGALRAGPDQSELIWQDRVEGRVWSMIAAENRLFVVTEQGQLYAYGPEQPEKVAHHAEPSRPTAANHGETEDGWSRQVEQLLGELGPEAANGGYALVLGIGSGRLIDELLDQSTMILLIIEPDLDQAEEFRQKLFEAGIYGDRAAVLSGHPMKLGLPPYLASLIVSETPLSAGIEADRKTLETLFNWLRPYGGRAYLLIDREHQQEFTRTARAADLAGAVINRHDHGLELIREGALPGAAGWTHQNADAANTVVSRDDLTKAPLGLLWFGGPANRDVLPRHGRGPVPQVSGGRLFILGPDSLGARDVYTGRLLWDKSLPGIGIPYDTTAHQHGADLVGSPYVSLADSVYVFHQDRCLRLDPATGKKLAEFRIPALAGNDYAGWGYIGVWEDLLIAGLEPQHFDDARPGRRNWNATSSRRLAVINRIDGSIKWTMEAEFGIRHNAIAAADGRLYVMDRLSDGPLDLLQRRGLLPDATPKLTAFDIRSGNPVWQTTEGLFGTWLAYSKEHDILIQAGRPPVDRRQGLADEPSDQLTAYRGSDGTRLWTRQGIDYRNAAMLHENRIIVHGRAFDLLTGEDLQRQHPLTGEVEPFRYQPSRNCGQLIASRHLITFRRGAASFVDLQGTGGTGSLGGFRAGCTPNLVPADGVLNAPDYTRTCICQYQLQTSLALIHMPEAESWTMNMFALSREPIQRMGINFGAPGDRQPSRAESLWLAWPAIGKLGGTSREVPLNDSQAAGRTVVLDYEHTRRPGRASNHQPVTVSPEHPDWVRFHRHSLLLPEEEEKGWIYASGLIGAEKIVLHLINNPDEDREKLYTVRLLFAEPTGEATIGRRLFNVELQGRQVLANFDVAKAAEGENRGVTREFTDIAVKDNLTVTLAPAENSLYPPVISGIEVIAR